MLGFINLGLYLKLNTYPLVVFKYPEYSSLKKNGDHLINGQYHDLLISTISYSNLMLCVKRYCHRNKRSKLKRICNKIMLNRFLVENYISSLQYITLIKKNCLWLGCQWMSSGRKRQLCIQTHRYNNLIMTI